MRENWNFEAHNQRRWIRGSSQRESGVCVRCCDVTTCLAFLVSKLASVIFHLKSKCSQLFLCQNQPIVLGTNCCSTTLGNFLFKKINTVYLMNKCRIHFACSEVRYHHICRLVICFRSQLAKWETPRLKDSSERSAPNRSEHITTHEWKNLPQGPGYIYHYVEVTSSHWTNIVKNCYEQSEQ